MTKQQLIEDNINLVYHIVNKYFPHCSADEDIIQCGMVGLCDAASRWDESKSKFSTFACLRISGEIKNEITRRVRHQGILSLDYPVSGEDGEKNSLGDFIVGEEDVYYEVELVDLRKLSERERKIYEYLKQGDSFADIGRKLGISRQAVWQTTRKLRTLRGIE